MHITNPNALDAFFNIKGTFAKVTFKSNPKPAAAFKGVDLMKVTTGVFRAGINYANMAVVKDAIANGDKDGVGPLPWGVWDKFPFTITHKGDTYLRLATAVGGKVTTDYFVNGVKVDKADFDGYLTPSAAAGRPAGDDLIVFTIKAANLIAVNGVDA
jgi:hypothetical protein